MTDKYQGSVTRIIPKKPNRFLGKIRWKKNSKKPAPNLIQFQFVMPAINKDFFMFTAHNDQ